jgi:hypothetical protein
MSFSWESCDTKSFYDTSITFTSSNTNNIAHIIFVENLVNWDFLFEEISNKSNFFLHSTSIDLDFHKMSFLVSKINFFWLSMTKSSDNSTVSGNSSEGNFV